jgi:hypothetical protein
MSVPWFASPPCCLRLVSFFLLESDLTRIPPLHVIKLIWCHSQKEEPQPRYPATLGLFDLV